MGLEMLPSQAHIWPQGMKSTAAFLSEHTTHSSICNARHYDYRTIVQKCNKIIHGLSYCTVIRLKMMGLLQKTNQISSVDQQKYLCHHDFRLKSALLPSILTLVRDWTWSLHMRHFLTRGEHREHVAMWPHGPNRVSRFMSEHTMHSSRDSWSFSVLMLHRMAELLHT